MRALLVLVLLGRFACSEAFPDRPLTVVIPFPSTGSTDIAGIPRISKLFRVMQTVSVPSLTDKLVEELRQALGGTLGQSINLYRRETRGKTNAGTRYVALAAADGHTLLFADNPTITIFPALNPHPPLDALQDLVPVATFAHMPIAMIASTDHPRSSVREAIERARRLPGSMNYASAGDGSTSHLTGELFRAMSGAHIVHVNYNGSLPALSAIMTSQVELGFVPLSAALPYLKGGKVRIIAVTNSTRHPLVPAVPTIAESGIEGFDASGWFGIFAPARTPGAIVSLLNYEINRALAGELLQRTLISQGLLPAPGTTEDFRALVEKDRGRWTRLLKTVGTADKRSF